MPRRMFAIIVLVGVLACSHGKPGTEPAPRGHSERGIASWYGEPFHGRRTASGEVYDMHGITAAHRTLPFGTWVRVKRRDTGASVEVRVNDRGPFIRGRIIDLSYGAARSIGLDVDGVAPVVVTVVKGPSRPPNRTRNEPRATSATCLWVQVGAFSRLANAKRNRDRLLRAGEKAVLMEGPGGLHRVRVGPFAKRSNAEDALRRLRRDYPPAAIVDCG